MHTIGINLFILPSTWKHDKGLKPLNLTFDRSAWVVFPSSLNNSSHAGPWHPGGLGGTQRDPQRKASYVKVDGGDVCLKCSLDRNWQSTVVLQNLAMFKKNLRNPQPRRELKRTSGGHRWSAVRHVLSKLRAYRWPSRCSSCANSTVRPIAMARC